MAGEHNQLKHTRGDKMATTKQTNIYTELAAQGMLDPATFGNTQELPML